MSGNGWSKAQSVDLGRDRNKNAGKVAGGSIYSDPRHNVIGAYPDGNLIQFMPYSVHDSGFRV